MSGVSAPVIWLVAVASAALLVTAGFVLAVTQLRQRLARSRKHIAGIQSVLTQRSSDPFNETRVLWDQLVRLRKRINRVARAVGDHTPMAALPELPAAAAANAAGQAAGAARASTAPVPLKMRAITRELEADLELFKREVYAKSKRITDLEAEKQRLAEKIVHLEEQLRTAPPPRPESSGPVPRVPGEPISMEEMTEMVDALQQEADRLRTELSEREAAIHTLVQQDETGLFHELDRIRKELRSRTDEASSLREKLRRMERLALQSRARAESLDQQKENMAARALEAAADLRQAHTVIRDLERQLAERPAVPPPAFNRYGAATPPPLPGQPRGRHLLEEIEEVTEPDPPPRPPLPPPKFKRR